MADADDQSDNFELINKEVTERLNRLSTSGSQLDTKSALLAGVAATATQFLASRQSTEPLLTTLAFVALGAAFFGALAAYAATQHHDVPEPKGLLGHRNDSHVELLKRLVVMRVDAFAKNHKRHRRKARLWWCSVGLLSVGLIFSTLAIVQNGGHDRAPVGQHPAVPAQQR